MSQFCQAFASKPSDHPRHTHPGGPQMLAGGRHAQAVSGMAHGHHPTQADPLVFGQGFQDFNVDIGKGRL